MPTRDAILQAAVKLLCEQGLEGLSTRAVCAAVGVKSPTLYHHFGSLDGLLDEVLGTVAAEFLAEKRAQPQTSDPRSDLEAGWDHVVHFSARYPHCYAAALTRMLSGVKFQALELSDQLLRQRVARAAPDLRVSEEEAVALLWSSAHAACLLGLPLSIDPSTERTGVLKEAVMNALFTE